MKQTLQRMKIVSQFPLNFDVNWETIEDGWCLGIMITDSSYRQRLS